MTILQIEIQDARPLEAICGQRGLPVTLAEGRDLRAPLYGYARLLSATPSLSNAVEFFPLGVHWPEIDEDLSIASILRGQKAPDAVRPKAQ